MVRLLNKRICLFIVLISVGIGYAQVEEENVKYQEKKRNERDYYKKEDFKKYGKRSSQVASWQIQNLKFGALVVRLQNNQRKIDAYRKIGNEDKALETQAFTQYYNRLVMNAYLSEFGFCKVYFIYAQSSDSLLKGVRKGFFLDTTLKVNRSIQMNESFYLLAEKDYVYNSSIGFVKEDSAKFVSETGAKTIEAPIVIKNKYGHQLKSPFPYYTSKAYSLKTQFFIMMYRVEVSEGVYKNVELQLSKEHTQKVQNGYVENMNGKLHYFYERCQGDQINDPALKPFLY